MTIHQISVFLENRPGQLAEITSALSASQIDLRAINIAEVTDYGVLRLIADQPERAASVLLEKGFILSMTPVVAVGVPDAPGGLAAVMEVFAQHQVDVEYMYSAFGRNGDQAFMIFRVADTDKVDQILRSAGITPADPVAMGMR